MEASNEQCGSSKGWSVMKSSESLFWELVLKERRCLKSSYKRTISNLSFSNGYTDHSYKKLRTGGTIMSTENIIWIDTIPCPKKIRHASNTHTRLYSYCQDIFSTLLWCLVNSHGKLMWYWFLLSKRLKTIFKRKTCMEIWRFLKNVSSIDLKIKIPNPSFI